MQFVGETQNRKVNFLLLPFNYTQMYNKLTTLLSIEDVRCLAKPEMVSGTTSWTAICSNDAKIVSLDKLTDEQKDELSDRLEDLKSNIISKLVSVKELQSLLAHLFTVPGTSDVMGVIENNVVYPLLLQWGCSSNDVNSSADPITSLINRPRTNSDHVEISFVYHTGDPAPLVPFQLQYRNLETSCNANSEGKYVLGRCKLDTHFSVHYQADNNSANFDFQVAKNRNYVVTITKTSNLELQVIDQNNQPVPQTQVIIRTDTDNSFQTDGEGRINLGAWKVGDELTAIDTIDDTNQLHHQVTADNTILTLKVVRYQKATCKIHVVDENKNPVEGYELSLEYNKIQENRITNNFGLIGVQDGLYVNNTIKIINPRNPANQLEAVLEQAENEIQFILIVLPPEFVTIKLVDKKKEPLENVPFELVIQGKKHNLTSDEKGLCVLPKELFKNQEWLTADFKITSKDLKKRLKKNKK